MGYVEEKLKELLKVKPHCTRPGDFDDFWSGQLAQNATVPLEVQATEYDYPSPYVRVYDIVYNALDGTQIHGWFIAPADMSGGQRPCVVCYHGFTGSRGCPEDHMVWVMQGWCVFAMDVRSQSGLTGDNHLYRTGLIENVKMQGITDREDSYLKFIYLDAVRALDFVCSRPEVDADRIAVTGGSQGGALSIVAASLDSRPCAVACDISSNCELALRIEREEGSFASIAAFLRVHPDQVDAVFRTIPYFDMVNHAPRIHCPVFASVGYKDRTCPIEYFFAAYNGITSEKQVTIYPSNGHGCGMGHLEKKLRFFQKQFHEV